MSTFSVTEVRNALRCPRIFALGRMKNRAVAFPIGSSCLGASFHRIVNRFAQTVETPPLRVAGLEEGAPLDTIEAELRAWVLGLLVDELDADATLTTMPGEVDDLAQALRELARHLAARLRRFPGRPSDALRKVLRDSERPIEAALEEGILLRGTLDALYGEPDDSLEVIEYKLTDDANDVLDRAQAALYGRLIELSTGMVPKPVVLRFMPMLRETAISKVEADDIVRRTVLPVVRGGVSGARRAARRSASGRSAASRGCRRGHRTGRDVSHPQRIVL
jgi:RecB family exonuclease